MIVGNVDAPSEVRGVHGGESSIFWKRFATGNMVFSDLDAFEWARVPAGALIGEHTHSRTEEIYFVVRGRGEITIDGDTQAVGPADLILTPLNATHSFRVIGEDDVEIIVCEVLPPAIAALLPEHTPEGPARS